jgi:hypothetical protein
MDKRVEVEQQISEKKLIDFSLKILDVEVISFLLM